MTAASLSTGFAVQRRVVFALMMRELHTRYGRDNIGYVWLILEPLMLAAAVALLHSRGPTHFGTDVKPVPLAILGYCTFITYRSIVNRAEGALEANLPLMYHRRVTVFDILFARALLEAAGTFLSLVVLMSLAVALGLANPPERPLLVLIAFAAMALLSFGISMMVCAWTHERPAAARFVHPVNYILMPLSGAFFCVAWLPRGIADVALWIPHVHIFELLRRGWFYGASDRFFDPLYIVVWTLCSLVGGMIALATLKHRIHLQ